MTGNVTRRGHVSVGHEVFADEDGETPEAEEGLVHVAVGSRAWHVPPADARWNPELNAYEFAPGAAEKWGAGPKVVLHASTADLEVERKAAVTEAAPVEANIQIGHKPDRVEAPAPAPAEPVVTTTAAGAPAPAPVEAESNAEILKKPDRVEAARPQPAASAHNAVAEARPVPIGTAEKGGSGAPPPGPPAAGGGPLDEEPAPEFSQAHVARVFVDAQRDNLYYVPEHAELLSLSHGEGKRYAALHRLEAADDVRRLCVTVAADCTDKKLAREIGSRRYIHSVLDLACGFPEIIRSRDAFDRDETLLNTPGGIVSLETGLIGPHTRHAMMTKITAVAPAGECPLWKRLLLEATADPEVVRALQIALGYLATGSTKEQKAIFLHGPGGSGKSTILNTVRGVAGSYAANVSMDLLVQATGERHSTDLVDLDGPRFVTASETKRGRKVDEQRFKLIVGGDPITARAMRQDNRTFTEPAKLLLAVNYLLSMHTMDAAMARRILIFPVSHAPAVPDLDLEQKLRGEWPGILEWLIEGAVEWYVRGGLYVPDAIKRATAEYLETEDLLGRFLDERCELTVQGTTFTRDAYRQWSSWCATVGEWPGREADFRQRLAARFKPWRHPVTRQRGFRGFRLVAADQELPIERSAPAAGESAAGADEPWES